MGHNRWEAACVAEDVLLAGRPDGDDDDDDECRFAYIRGLLLVTQHRETV